MNRFLSVAQTTFIGLVVALGSHAQEIPAAEKRIAIGSFSEHPAQVAVMKGTLDGLKEAGLTEANGYRIEIQNAHASPVIAMQIAKKFIGERPDVIVALGTGIAQPLVANVKDIPIVFGAAANPLGAKLVTNYEKPGGNATGTHATAPIEPLVAMMERIHPNAKSIGIIYNAGEANSRAGVDTFKKAAGSRWQFAEATVTRQTEVQAALQSLAGKVDAIYVPNDVTVISTFEVLQRFSKEARVPIYCSDPNTAARGALACVGVNFYDDGRVVAKIVERILKGEPAGSIPVFVPTETEAVLNKSAASALGMSIPEEIQRRFTRMVD